MSAFWWKRPMAWVDFRPSSFSSGSIKVWNMSRIIALARRSALFASWLTSVVKTIGGTPSLWNASLILPTAICAFSGVSTKGMRTLRKRISNWARMEWLKVSAVMPVPSETMNTVRTAGRSAAWGAGAAGLSACVPGWDPGVAVPGASGWDMGRVGINRFNLPQKSAAQHGRIAAIFSLSNSIGWPAPQHARATNRARNCRQCALRDESRSARSAAPVRGCLAKRSVREQNINNIPGMRNQFSTLF
ncbi:hypothetical protein CBM2633_A70138 [Cupriavidus taiwanensis]|nr:hypothetical protein CBM2614_A210061 [Cupriavidus taiwanensis]SOZ97730.1 hypothetical protein CBM2626_A130076 [Cupriavidus taiwanensis]SPA16042.1 hypothetical protein CBM2633_A70138 [Cupriavidus taiwanensis]